MNKLLILTMLIFSSCAKDGIEKYSTNNSQIKVELLLTHDGCVSLCEIDKESAIGMVRHALKEAKDE